MGAVTDFVARTLGLATKADVEQAQFEAYMRGRGMKTASGVEIQDGRFDVEYLAAFKGSKRFETLDLMESDAHVKDVLDAAILPLYTGKWEVQPASDKAIDKEVAEFVAAVLLRESTDRYGKDFWCMTPPEQRIQEECDALRVGYALFVPTYRRVGDKIVYDRVQWLEPDTIDPYRGWELDDEDRIVAVRRQYRKPGGYWEVGETIKAQNLRVFAWDVKGARYEGRSLLRSMYAAWFRKDFFLRQAAAWAQKAGSPVPVGYYPPTYNANEIQDFIDTVKAMRGSAPNTAFAALPQSSQGIKPELGYAGSDSDQNVDRMRGLIDGENAEMAHAGKTKSKLLGETQTGSRAVGSEQSEDEDLFRQAVSRWLQSQENHGFANLDGWVEPLVYLNFANAKNCPRIVCSRIGPKEDRTAVQPLIQVWSAASVPVAVRKAASERLGFNFDPEFYAEQEEREEQNREMADEARRQMIEPGGGQPASTDAKDDDGDESPARLEVPADLKAKYADLLTPREGQPPSGSHRMPNRLEAEVVNLADVADGLERGKADYHQELRVIRDEMTADLVGRLRAGKVTPRNLDGLRRSKFRRQSKAEMRLLEVLGRIVTKGAEDVERELDRMGA